MRLLTLMAIGTLATLALLPRPAEAQDTRASLDGFDRTCLTEHLKNCQVLSAGYLNAEEEPLRVAYQTQAGFTDDDGVIGGIVLLSGQPDGSWTVIGEEYLGYRYSTPVLTLDNLLHVAGYTGGTGAGNADLLFAATDDGWQKIDIESWKSTVGEKLPTGLEIWKGVAYDFDDPQYVLTARTPLWRGEDGNCCPSGGDAVVVFTIENNALVVDEVVYRAPAQD